VSPKKSARRKRRALKLRAAPAKGSEGGLNLERMRCGNVPPASVPAEVSPKKERRQEGGALIVRPLWGQI
jgi:hypothetical protein